MSTTYKTVLALIVLVIVVAGGLYYWFYVRTGINPFANTEAVIEEESVPATTTLPSGDSTTDAALDEDLAAISAQLDALGSDSANIDAGLEEAAAVQ